jgi:hypothetical protein
VNLLDLGNELKKLFGNTTQYFNPTSNQGNNFWSTPVAQTLGNAQKSIQTQYSPQNLQKVATNAVKTAIPPLQIKPLREFLYNQQTNRILPNSPIYPENRTPEKLAQNPFYMDWSNTPQANKFNQEKALNLAMTFSGGMENVSGKPLSFFSGEHGTPMNKSQGILDDLNNLYKQIEIKKANTKLTAPEYKGYVEAQKQIADRMNQLGQGVGVGQLEKAGTTISKANKERGFVTSVKETSQVSNPTKQGVTGNYAPKPNTTLMGEAQSLLNEGASIKFNQVQGLDKKVTATIQEAINLDKAGNHQAAANLYNNLSEHATELGRGVQAFSMIDSMSPEAISLSVAGKIKNYNRTAIRKIPELTEEQQQLISQQVAKIDSLTGRDKNIAINELQNVINNFIPSSIADKAITVWKAGLLTSLRTHERNLIGNTIMGASEIAKDIPATVADMLMSLRTGKRSMSPTLQGSLTGAKKGAISMKDIVTKGYDPEEAISKFDVHKVTWGNNPVEQFLKKATDAVYRPLAGEDKVFWHSSYARSLYDQAATEAINVGKQGNQSFIENLVKNPTEQMGINALKDANYATFHDQNVLTGVANSIKRAAQSNKLGPVGSEIGKVVTEVLAPFTGVPSSIVGKTMAYSPIGLVKGAVNMGRVLVQNIPELQRQAAQEVGRGVLGTGLFGLGAYLMSKGLMTGQPKDATEANLWATQNKPSNSVFINGKWRSIGSIGPQNLVMLAGAKYQEEMGKQGGEDIGAYAGNLAKDQLGQTFLAKLPA